MPGHALPPSARRDFLDNHDQQLRDAGRDRPFVPSSLTDLSDVIDDQGVYDGQAVHYDKASGVYLHQSRQVPFGAPGTLVTGSTGLLELPYAGEATTFVVLLKTAGTSSTVLHLEFNGTTISTATLAAGISRVQYGIVPAQAVTPFADTLEVFVDTVGSGAAGLTGYILT